MLVFLFFFPSMTSMCQGKEGVQTVKVTDKNKANAEAKTLLYVPTFWPMFGVSGFLIRAKDERRRLNLQRQSRLLGGTQLGDK